MRSASEIKLVAPAIISDAIQTPVRTAMPISKVLPLEFGATTTDLAAIVTNVHPVQQGSIETRKPFEH